MSSPRSEARINAVLGPTNTGKTRLAIDRMLGRSSGVIGLPLRLLAREVYDRVVEVKGRAAAALITGEEKIAPKTARYFVATAEAMPLSKDVAFVALDEAQLASDPDRGHIFTQRLLHARGTEETMLLGAETIRPLIRHLIPRAEHDARERFSTLTHAGQMKLTRLPRRTAIVAFSAEEVYAIAELLRRQKGGSAVVMGALSPRTRNAQVELYQSGEVDYLVATDAIGMGLNMDVDHVAFASLRKFDGRRRRPLRPEEIAQIAGRAGRFRNDGTFGVTADCMPIPDDVAERVTSHEFEPIGKLHWRNNALNFASLEALQKSLRQPSPDPSLLRVREAIDEAALSELADDAEISIQARGRGAVERLWSACQLPDFRKSTREGHIQLVATIARHLLSDRGVLPTDWVGEQIAKLDDENGDVDALAGRLTYVRTWTYAANRSDWLADPEHWRAVARGVEDRLSDALHERLTQRFVDRRTSALVRGLRIKGDLEVEIAEDGKVSVEGHYVGRLNGFTFTPDREGGGLDAKTLRAAAEKVLRPELDKRLGALIAAENKAIELRDDGSLWWEGKLAGRLLPGPEDLRPDVRMIGAELASDGARAKAHERLVTWINARIAEDLAPLHALTKPPEGVDVRGLARGLAFQLAENFGAVDRKEVADQVDQLGPDDRRSLRAIGVRIAEHGVFTPELLKPKPARLMSILLAAGPRGKGHPPFLPPAGRASVPAERIGRLSAAAAGYRRCGDLLIRRDMLERLADEIRTARTLSVVKHAFPATDAMLAVIGASREQLSEVLKSLGYRRAQASRAVVTVDGYAEGEVTAPETWRTSRPGARPGQHSPARHDRKGGGKGVTQNDGKGGGPGKGKGKPRGPAPKREPEIDPDNPFAALAALKTQGASSGGGKKNRRGKR